MSHCRGIGICGVSAHSPARELILALVGGEQRKNFCISRLWLRHSFSPALPPTGNVFVIAAIILERNLQNVANYLVASLAVADLFVACLVMPLGALYEVRVPQIMPSMGGWVYILFFAALGMKSAADWGARFNCNLTNPFPPDLWMDSGARSVRYMDVMRCAVLYGFHPASGCDSDGQVSTFSSFHVIIIYLFVRI